MKLRDWLIPQDKIFFTLLREQVVKVVKATKIFHQAIIKNKFDQKTVKRIKKLEKECDSLIKQIFDQLNKTFITPIDHEDIGKLTINCDDLIDLIYTIACRLLIYHINGRNIIIKSFSRIIKKMIDQVELMMLKAEKLKQEPLLHHAKEIHRLENQADDLLLTSLKEVFKLKDTKRIIKEKEIYERLEILTDKIENFCDLIQGVVTKNL